MNLVLIADTPDNIKKLNRSREFRKHIASLANYWGERIVLAIIANDSLTPKEKDAALCEWALADVCLRIQMVRCGQRKWGFPRYPISGPFLDWYMNLALPGGAISRYVWLTVTGAIGDFALAKISRGDIEIPSILNNLAEIAIANIPGLQRNISDFVASCGPETEMPTFSQDEALERIANALAKPFVAKANEAVNDDTWNDALEGVWRGSKALLERSALDNFREAFAGSELQNYIRKSIQNQLRQELRRVQRDQAKRQASGFTEIMESDLALIRDDEGDSISPLELIPEIIQENIELIEMFYLAARDLSERELAICDMWLEGKTKKQIAKELGISRPTLDRYLKAMHKKLGDLKSGELGVSLSDLFRPGSIKVRGKWQPCPDPTAYKAMIAMIREELNRLVR